MTWSFLNSEEARNSQQKSNVTEAYHCQILMHLKPNDLAELEREGSMNLQSLIVKTVKDDSYSSTYFQSHSSGGLVTFGEFFGLDPKQKETLCIA